MTMYGTPWPGSYVDGRALLAGWGGEPYPAGPTLGAVETDAASAQFLEEAKNTIRMLRTQAEGIGPAPWFASRSYYELWTPIVDGLVTLYNEGRGRLRMDSTEFATFRDTMIALNRDVAKLRSAETSNADAFRAAMALMTLNPLMAMDVVLSQVQAIPGIVADVGTAAQEIYIDPLVQFWNNYGGLIKVSFVALLGLVGLNAIGSVRR